MKIEYVTGGAYVGHLGSDHKHVWSTDSLILQIDRDPKPRAVIYYTYCPDLDTLYLAESNLTVGTKK